jgi:tetratricopeptide (TPR) repeat protein
MSALDVPQLREIRLFSGLSKASLRFLQDRMHYVDYPAGVMIVRAGMRCDYMAIVSSGKIELRSVSGDVQMIDRGGVFGQSMMRYAAPSACSIVTVEPTTLWVIGRSDWLAVNELSAETSAKRPVKAKQVMPKGIASDLLHFRSSSRERPIRTSEAPRVNRLSGIQFKIPGKRLATLIALAMVGVVLGPAFLGWTDFLLVRLCLQAQQPRLAESYLTLASSLRPSSAVLQDALGYVRYLQVEPDQALEQFRRAVELQSDLASAQNNLGVALLARGKPEEALPHFQAAVDSDPGDATAYLNLGNALLATGDSASAMAAYQEAFTLDPALADAQAHWAILALKEGRVSEARLVLQKASATDPELALARQGLGVAAFIEGQPAVALPELEKARELDPQDISTRLYLGLTLKELDRPMDAAIEFMQILVDSQDPVFIGPARENLQQVYEQLMLTGLSENGTIQKGGEPASDH